ncbi:MAG: hypothetical protein N2560_05455 [Ignavibacteria bacterium]|nr:hypothetical protein [Ignavibacteria bacterium]
MQYIPKIHTICKGKEHGHPTVAIILALHTVLAKVSLLLHSDGKDVFGYSGNAMRNIN